MGLLATLFKSAPLPSKIPQQIIQNNACLFSRAMAPLFNLNICLNGNFDAQVQKLSYAKMKLRPKNTFASHKRSPEK